MKIMIVTTPIRPQPTVFPPFGALSIVTDLRRNGFADAELYNIDQLRPPYEEALAHIVETKPDILGISAVVSTAYEFSKRLACDVKEALPETLIVLGGNMAASSNVLLHKTGVDICVLGEGERVFLNLARRAETTRNPDDFCDIPGLTLLDRNGHLINTGYEPQMPADELYEVDWDILEEGGNIEFFYADPHEKRELAAHFEKDPRFYEPHRIGKTLANLYTSKGCVSRCTFCHRWDKGLRIMSVDLVMRRLDELIERYNVGFLTINDENFGSDRRWLKEFSAAIKERDVLWFCGTRVKGITSEILEMLRDSGCTAVVYGNETGSERMLEIMEKKVSLEDNYAAMKATFECGMNTYVQLVMGMPGESPETVAETTEYCKQCLTLAPRQNPNDLSVNYAQALPGTPLYEYARSKGMIARDLDGEERYLLQISDRDAHDEYTTLNFTDYPKLIVETWRPLISIDVNYHYVQRFGLEHYHDVMLAATGYFQKERQDTGYYANPRRLVATSAVEGAPTPEIAKVRAARSAMPSLWRMVFGGQWGLALICYPVAAYRIRRWVLLLVILKNFRKSSASATWGYIKEYVAFRWRSLFNETGRFAYEYKSLRKIVDVEIGELPGDEAAMAPLRRGR